MSRHPQVGDSVVCHDSKGKAHNALITCYFGQNVDEDVECKFEIGCANLVWVSSDESRKDDYGRQTERQTSLVHKSSMPAHGNYWRWPDEEPNPYQAPTSV